MIDKGKNYFKQTNRLLFIIILFSFFEKIDVFDFNIFEPYQNYIIFVPHQPLIDHGRIISVYLNLWISQIGVSFWQYSNMQLPYLFNFINPRLKNENYIGDLSGSSPIMFFAYLWDGFSRSTLNLFFKIQSPL